MTDKYILGIGNRVSIPSTLEDLDRLVSRLEFELSLKPNGVIPEIKNIKKIKPEVSDNSVHITPSEKYEITEKFDNYALGVENIRTIPITQDYTQKIFKKPDGSQIYRQLTMLESLEVIVNDYNTLKDTNRKDRTPEDRKRLLSNYKYTCTGIAYKTESREIKIIPECKELILIPSDYKKRFLNNPYNTLVGNILNTTTAKYNQSLTESEVNNHPAWIALVEETQHGRNILKAYSNIIFKILSEKQQTIGMGLYTRQYDAKKNTATDELRSLYVGSVGFGSVASGNSGLDDGAPFLLVAPSQSFLVNQ